VLEERSAKSFGASPSELLCADARCGAESNATAKTERINQLLNLADIRTVYYGGRDHAMSQKPTCALRLRGPKPDTARNRPRSVVECAEPDGFNVTRSDKAKQLRIATYASVFTAIVLIGVKLAAWLWTGSVSILASLIDSLMDSIASTINLFAVRYSLMPPDEEHRFGHGKAEPLAGLAQSAFICGSALFLVLHAVDRLRFPRDLQQVGIGVAVMVLAIVLTAGLLVIQRRVIRHTQSTAIRADAFHYATDLLTNMSVIIALFLTTYGWAWADSVMAIGVAAYVFYGAARIGYEAFQHLMDRELPTEVQEQILAIAYRNPRVRGAHDLRTRQSGQVKFVQLHLELDNALTLTQAHAIADEIEQEISALLPEAEVIIHQDPANVTEHTDRKLWPPPNRRV
jgi:ferrous-iron efflux pump FieF